MWPDRVVVNAPLLDEQVRQVREFKWRPGRREARKKRRGTKEIIKPLEKDRDRPVAFRRQAQMYPPRTATMIRI